jgi:hypothetical protein
MGVRFQERIGGEANEVILHVNMRDQSGVQQQEALGILGVNLLYALYFERGSAEEFLRALLAGLEKGRLEIDLIDINGDAFRGWDQKELLALLVTGGMAEAVAFPAEGRARPPSEVVYKAPVVLAPGSFEHVAPVHGRILAAGVAELRRELAKSVGREPEKRAADPVGAFSLSAAAGVGKTAPSAGELTARVGELRRFGAPVLLTRFVENYHAIEVVNRYTSEPVRFAVGESALFRIFAETYYKHLDGQILEGIARLFARNVKFYVYPMEESALHAEVESLRRDGWEIEVEGKRVGADHSRPPLPLGHLYDYLLGSGFVVPMRAGEV